jgi:hypothetical protein
MSDLERRRADQKARDTVGRRSSADRARLWASLNKHLPPEARHAPRVVEEGRRPGRERPDDRRS